MSKYLFLQKAYVNDRLYEAGEVAETIDAGGTLPIDWPPIANVDCLDDSAVECFYRRGPQQHDLIVSRYVDDGVRLPRVFWRQLPGSPIRYELVGSNKPPIIM
jgi:hypothetical protein